MAQGFNMDESYRSMRRKFDTYRTLLMSVAAGELRHLVVYGSPGLGKTYEAEDVFAPLVRANKIKYHRAAGYTTPLAVYNQLFEMRGHRNFTLFDDCDAAFKNEQSLNILKAATDTKAQRVLSWHSTSKAVLSTEFVYAGTLLILTNEDLTRGKFASFVDRILHLNLQLTIDERVSRVLEVIHTETHYKAVHDEVSMWIIEHFPRLGEKLTIRTAIKAMELASTNHDRWKELAEMTILAAAG